MAQVTSESKSNNEKKTR